MIYHFNDKINQTAKAGNKRIALLVLRCSYNNTTCLPGYPTILHFAGMCSSLFFGHQAYCIRTCSMLEIVCCVHVRIALHRRFTNNITTHFKILSQYISTIRLQPETNASF